VQKLDNRDKAFSFHYLSSQIVSTSNYTPKRPICSRVYEQAVLILIAFFMFRSYCFASHFSLDEGVVADGVAVLSTGSARFH
jgi:hypothetical protein